jgi:dihydroorotate dehydrogenase (NAD+) catalytic subunit
VSLARVVAGIRFTNPILLASGTAGYGREVAGVIALQRLGGLITKAVSLKPRAGNSAPRVAEFHGGMLNSVGLANPGVVQVRDDELRWLRTNTPALPVLVNVIGFTAGEYADVIRQLDDATGHAGYELNLSCPNTSAGGVEFGADSGTVRDVVARCRAVTRRPLFAKLSPVLPDIPAIARAAHEAGADGITLVNTLPGQAYHRGRLRLGNGFGGMSGPALLPVGLRAVSRTTESLPGVPVIGVGGISHADHARDYFRAGAALVAVGTAALADPRLPERIIADLERTDG